MSAAVFNVPSRYSVNPPGQAPNSAGNVQHYAVQNGATTPGHGAPRTSFAQTPGTPQHTARVAQQQQLQQQHLHQQLQKHQAGFVAASKPPKPPLHVPVQQAAFAGCHNAAQGHCPSAFPNAHAGGQNAFAQASPQWPSPQLQALAAPQFQPPATSAPPSLTAGLPDPQSVEMQRDAYLRTLDEQKAQCQSVLDEQRKQHLDYIHSEAEQQKRTLLMQVDQQVKQLEATLAQQYNQQLMQLTHQYHQQRATLEQQAITLTAEFQQRQVQEEAMVQNFRIAKERSETEQRFAAEMQRLQWQSQRPSVPHMGYVPPDMPTAHHQSYTPPPVGANADMYRGWASYTPPPVTSAPQSQGSHVPQPDYTNFLPTMRSDLPLPPTEYAGVPMPTNYGMSHSSVDSTPTTRVLV